jgi:acetyl/propionyl-CoA carboxylase alpha subunit
VFDTILVADRGLVACRVVRTCQRLGARTVTVHSAADAGRRHSTCADESLLLGPSDEASTYLDGLKVIEAAGQAAAQAVHPGSGVLARSAAFAAAVQDAGLTWVGPPPSVLAALEPLPQPVGASVLTVTVLSPVDAPVLVLGESLRTGGRSAAPGALPDQTRERARAAAVSAAADTGLVGLASVVVHLDGNGAASGAALQPWLDPDHAVVELVTGTDLVERQLLLAAGRDAGADEGRPAHGAAAGIALRARASGRVDGWRLPADEGLRVEIGCGEGEEVAPSDGPLVTLAAWGETQAQAQERLAAACDELAVEGIELEEDV